MPAVLRPDLFSDDATQHVYWLYRYADSSLFPGDLTIEYFGSLSVAPWGYRALYAVLSPLGDALLVAKIVSGVLLMLSAYMAWLLGKALNTAKPAITGLLTVAVTLALLPAVDLLPAMGFQRTFALPITLLCIWALVAYRYFWVGISWILASLVYPVIVPVLGLTAGLVFLMDIWRDRRMPPHWLWNGAAGVVTIAVVLLTRDVPQGIGPMVTFAQAQVMPEFGANGRQSLFGNGFSAYWFGHHRTGLGWSPRLILLLGVTTVIVVLSGNRRLIPRAVWTVAGVGVTLWFAARLTLFDLYLPNRHSRWSLAAYAVVMIAVATYGLAAKLFGPSSDTSRRWHWVALCASFVAPVVVSLALYPSASRAWHQTVDHDLEGAYQYIKTLPKDTLVASHPTLADPVPLRTRRSVLASTETWISFQLGYNAQLTPRLEASLQAAYATTWEAFDRALSAYGVDAFLVTPELWRTTDYSPPFDELVRKLVLEGKQRGFALDNPPADRVLYRSGDVYVLRVGQVSR